MQRIISLTVAVLFAAGFSFAEQISFSAEKMSGSTGESSEYSKLSGNAYIKTKSMEIRADEIILSGKEFRFITATGKVSGKSSESKFDFSCEQMDFDRTTEIVMLKGNVTLLDRDNDVKASAQLIEFNQKTEVANMQIDVKLLQKKNVCTGANAVYKKSEQTLELSGAPQIIKDKDTFKANEISMNLKTEEITLDGKVRGSVTQSKSEEKSEEDSKGKAENSTESTNAGSSEGTKTETGGNSESASKENANSAAAEKTASESSAAGSSAGSEKSPVENKKAETKSE